MYPAAPSLCGTGGWWQYRLQCYLVVTDMPAVGWDAAQMDCRRRSANLAKIQSAAENANIFHRVSAGGVSGDLLSGASYPLRIISYHIRLNGRLVGDGLARWSNYDDH